MSRHAHARDHTGALTREGPIRSRAATAILVVDVQYYAAAAGHGCHATVDPEQVPEDLAYYFDRLRRDALPNIRRLQEACRAAGVEVLFTTVEALTADCRDNSLDYEISGIRVPKGSKEAQVLDEVAPVGDEIVFPKTTSSVFGSTTIDYVLRNLGIERLIVVGLLTDQCVDSSVRDACDRGYLVTLVEDACATYSAERHAWALRLLAGYCKTTTTDLLLAEIAAAAP